MENIDKIHITNLIDVKILQKMQDAFAKMARMAALTTDENGIPVTKGTNFSRFCMDYCRKSSIGKARCEKCDKLGALKALKEQKPVYYFCHAHLVDFAAPIMLGGRMIGSFIGGQVLTEPPDFDKMRMIARELEVDEDEFINAAKETQIVPRQAIIRSTEFIYEFAGILSDMAYKEYIARQLSSQAMQAATQKSDFLANMSHEIRTPMNAVLGMAELALREEMSPQAKQYIRQIRSSGKNLLVIINDILDFSKIESGKMDIIEMTYEPLSLINDLASIVNKGIGDKNIEFTIDLNSQFPHQLFGDNVRIHQILINLLNNAVKFTQQGCVHLSLSYEIIDESTIMMKASISDTGIGIKKQDLTKLFQSFQQVDSKRNRNIEGTGLGLAISQNLLKLMKGHVWVESEYEKGSTFSFELPQKIISSTPIVSKKKTDIHAYLMIENTYLKEQLLRDLVRLEVSYDEFEANSKIENIHSGFFLVEMSLFNQNLQNYVINYPKLQCIVITPYDATKQYKADNICILRKPVYCKNLSVALGLTEEEEETLGSDGEFTFLAPEASVLIVDDNEINLAVASGILEPLKMKIDTADSAKETIKQIKKTTYDLIFMDHMMPDVDGVETTHIIRRMFPEYANVPIIALTANAVGDTKEMFLQEGMNDFVAKPVDTKAMVSMIRKWLPVDKIIPLTKEEQLKDNIKKTEEQTIEIKGLDTERAIRLLGNKTLYMQILQDYYCSLHDRIDILTAQLDEKDYKNYTINVHSLKSTSRQIGADDIADLAARLEQAGHEEQYDIIHNNHSELVEKSKICEDILHDVFPDLAGGISAGKSAATSDMVQELLQEMITALDEMDTLAIDDAVEKMAAYSYSDMENELFEKIKTYAETCDLDECMAVVKEWMELL